jgi:hypothetical protein
VKKFFIRGFGRAGFISYIFSGTLLKDEANRSGSVFGRMFGFIVLIKCPFGIFEIKL